MEKRDSGARKSLFLLPLLPGNPVPCLPSICSDDRKHLSSWALHLTGASQVSGNFWLSLAPLLPAEQRAWEAPEATYSASWSWGSARPRCRRSRGCGHRRCQSIRFLWEENVRPMRWRHQWKAGDGGQRSAGQASSKSSSISPSGAPQSASRGAVPLPSGTGGTAPSRSIFTVPQ